MLTVKKRTFLIGILATFVAGCATVPASTAPLSTSEAETSEGVMKSYESLPFMVPNEYVYFLDQRMPNSHYIKGFLVLQADNKSISFATRTINVSTSAEARKEIRTWLNDQGEIESKVLLSSYDPQLNDPALDVADAEIIEFLYTMLNIDYEDAVFLEREYEVENYGTVRWEMSLFAPVFNIFQVDFVDQQVKYLLLTGGLIQDNDYDVFFKKSPLFQEVETAGGTIPPAMTLEMETEDFLWKLDTNWKQNDFNGKSQYWLQVNGIRDAYVQSIRFPHFFTNFKELFVEASNRQITALMLRQYLSTYENIFYPHQKFHFYDNGSADFEVMQYDDLHQATMHSIRVFVDGDDYVLALVGGYRDIILDNEEYFQEIMDSLKPLASTQPPNLP